MGDTTPGQGGRGPATDSSAGSGLLGQQGLLALPMPQDGVGFGTTSPSGAGLQSTVPPAGAVQGFSLGGIDLPGFRDIINRDLGGTTPSADRQALFNAVGYYSGTSPDSLTAFINGTPPPQGTSAPFQYQTPDIQNVVNILNRDLGNAPSADRTTLFNDAVQAFGLNPANATALINGTLAPGASLFASPPVAQPNVMPAATTGQGGSTPAAASGPAGAPLTGPEQQASQIAATAGQPNPFQTQSASLATTAGGVNPFEQQAAGSLNQFLSGPLGQDPATLAAQNAFKQFQEPEILQHLNLAGLGSSGAVGESLARGEAAALVPFMTADLQNRLTASGQLGQLGSTLGSRQLGAAGELGTLGGNIVGQGLQGANLLANIGGASANRQLQALGMQQQGAFQQAQIGNQLADRQRADLLAAIQAAQIPQTIAMQQAEAAYRDFLRQQALAEGVTLGPLGQSILPSQLGGQVQSSSGGGIFGK